MASKKDRFSETEIYRTLAIRRKSLNILTRSSRSQVFLKIGVLKKIRSIHRKTRVLESLFNKVAGLKASKRQEIPTQMFSFEQLFL